MFNAEIGLSFHGGSRLAKLFAQQPRGLRNRVRSGGAAVDPERVAAARAAAVGAGGDCRGGETREGPEGAVMRYVEAGRIG